MTFSSAGLIKSKTQDLVFQKVTVQKLKKIAETALRKNSKVFDSATTDQSNFNLHHIQIFKSIHVLCEHVTDELLPQHRVVLQVV